MKYLEKPLIIPLVTFAITFAVYCITLAPDVTFTDAGELAAVASTLGIAHPTGYPLFTLLGHLWTLLPIPGTVIFRMNLFAAFCTAASAGMFAMLVRIFLQRLRSAEISPIAILTSALLFGFSVTVWEQSCSVEVYSLQLLLFNVILILFMKAIGGKEASQMALWAWAFVLGLGFTNHGTTILLAPASIYLFFRRENNVKPNYKARFREMAMLAMPFIAGLSIWLYLPIRASANPVFNWGGVDRSFDKFWYHASGKQYQGWMFQWSAVPDNIKHFIALLPKELGWIGLLALFTGFVIVLKSSKRLFVFLSLLLVGCLIYSLSYAIHDIDSYFSLAVIAILLFAAAGINEAINRYKKYSVAVAIVPIALALALNFGAVNQRSNYLVSEYTRILTENLEPNAVILSHLWDFWCSAFWYRQQVEGYRPDIVLIETELVRRTWYPDKVEKWYPNALLKCAPQKEAFLKELTKFEAEEPYSNAIIQDRYVQLLNAYIDSNYARRPVYLTGDVAYDEPAVAANYIKIPVGFAWRLVKQGDSIPFPLPSAKTIDITKFAASLPGAAGYLERKIRDLAASNLDAIAEINNRGGDMAAAEDAHNKSAIIRSGIPRINTKRR